MRPLLNKIHLERLRGRSKRRRKPRTEVWVTQRFLVGREAIEKEQLGMFIS